jgi:hypothetical protein
VRMSSEAAIRVQDPKARMNDARASLHGPRALKCKETLTLTLGGLERRASDAEASARVHEPEARKKADGLEVQGIQYVGASNGEIILTLGRPGERCASSAEAFARGPRAQKCKVPWRVQKLWY